MGLHLNLYHEIDRERRAKQRDPLKLSIFALGAVAALFGGYYFLELSRMSEVNSELARKKAEFDTIEPEAKAARLLAADLSGTITASQKLVQRIEGRFYWAPLLEEIATVVPPEVQIIKMAGDLQGETVKKCTLTLDGISAGPDPRKVAEELRTAIAEQLGKKYQAVTSTFRALEDGAEMVQLKGGPAPTANFAINVQLTSGEEAPAAPVVRERKKR